VSSLKKKTSNAAVWIIMLLLIAGLGGFGVSNFGGSNTSMVTVGDTEVDVNQYYRALNQELRAIQNQTGQPFSLNQAIAFGIDQNVRSRLVTEAALDNEAKRIGLSVGDERVKTEVLAYPAFQGQDGKFDRTAYKASLNQAGMSEAEFEESLRTETARTILQGAIVNGVAAPSAMTDAFLGFNLQRRNFSWIKLDQTSLPEQLAEPTDAQLQDYYQANKADFTEPEKKTLAYIWLTPDMIVDQVQVSEEALKKEYASRKSQYSSPETRLVERLVYPDAEAAKAAKARLDANEATFEELVKERGLELLDIDLGNVAIKDLGQAGKAVFAMEKPGVIGPVTTDLGPALFRMNGILAAQETTFDQARDELQAELALDQARRQINTSITDIDDLLAGGASLADVAAETDMKLASINWAAGDSTDIASYSAFRKAAEAVNMGDYAEVKELGDGGIFALEFTEVIAPALKPIDQVMASVIAGWEAKEVGERLTVLSDDLLARLGKGDEFSALGFDVTDEHDILRSANIEAVPVELMEAVFEMAKGETRSIPADGAVFLVKLDDILPPDAQDPDLETQKTALENGISQALSQDIFAAFNAALQNEAGVYVNRAAVNAVHAQFPQ